METQDTPTPHFIQHGSTKQFFLHTLDHLTKSNIITPYTRDKLSDMIRSEAKRDFAKVRKHVLDIMALHDTFDEAVATFEANASSSSNSNHSNNITNNNNEKQQKKIKIIAYIVS